MKVTRPVLGKILCDTAGLGTPSAKTVRRRAQEIALIEGRDKYNERDWKEAFLELHGGHHDPLESSGLAPDDEMVADFNEAEMLSYSTGHQTPRTGVEGEMNLGEELISEGLDEAEHNQMLQARREIDLPESELD